MENNKSKDFFKSVIEYFINKNDSSDMSPEIETLDSKESESFVNYYSSSAIKPDKIVVDVRSKELPTVISLQPDVDNDISPLKFEKILSNIEKSLKSFTGVITTPQYNSSNFKPSVNSDNYIRHTFNNLKENTSLFTTFKEQTNTINNLRENKEQTNTINNLRENKEQTNTLRENRENTSTFDVIKEKINLVSQILHTNKEKVSEIINNIKPSVDVMSLPSFAKMGMVSKPTLSVVGDAKDGLPEYVVGERFVENKFKTIAKQANLDMARRPSQLNFDSTKDGMGVSTQTQSANSLGNMLPTIHGNAMMKSSMDIDKYLQINDKNSGTSNPNPSRMPMIMPASPQVPPRPSNTTNSPFQLKVTTANNAYQMYPRWRRVLG